MDYYEFKCESFLQGAICKQILCKIPSYWADFRKQTNHTPCYLAVSGFHLGLKKVIFFLSFSLNLILLSYICFQQFTIWSTQCLDQPNYSFILLDDVNKAWLFHIHRQACPLSLVTCDFQFHTYNYNTYIHIHTIHACKQAMHASQFLIKFYKKSCMV